jgi:hypothetical protein
VVLSLAVVLGAIGIIAARRARDPGGGAEEPPIVQRVDAGSLANAAAPAVESPLSSGDPDGDPLSTTNHAPAASEPRARLAAIAVAREIWAKLDQLPGRTYRTRGALRSKALLEATLRRANAGADELAPADADAVHAFNAVESRRRFPALLGAGEKGSVRGADATTIVPSSDAEQCRNMAESWLEGDVPRVLLDVGFSEIGCQGDGGFTSWKLDGHL